MAGVLSHQGERTRTMKKGIPHVKSINVKPDFRSLGTVEKFVKNQFMPLKEK